MGKHKKIYAFDFDGTLCTNEFPKIGEPIEKVINLAKKVKSKGDYIILNTMREGEMLDKAVKWCQEQGIKFDAINDNLPHMKDFYKNNPRKIFANYYIDDHNMFVDEVNSSNNNITAKEMFDKLGYKKRIESYVEGELRMIEYVNLQNYDFVTFDLSLEFISLEETHNSIDSLLLSAINKQCSELGWIDE